MRIELKFVRAEIEVDDRTAIGGHKQPEKRLRGALPGIGRSEKGRC